MPRKLIDPWADAVAHLAEADPRWVPIIERVGPCLLRPRRDRFGTLVRAIVGQQISTKAAASIDAKLRAIVGDPLLLIADEPTGDLDRSTAFEILGLLDRLNTELGKTIVMVTHDPRAAEAAHHLIYLDKGQLSDTSPFGH